MGYSTSFSLDVMESDKTIQELMEEIQETHEEVGYYFDDVGDSWDSFKWYDHINDMKELSKYYKDVVFVLKGEGEEAGDVWIKYFKNGKMQDCPAKITFDEYDENKLR